MQRFDCLSRKCPLLGPHLLEASAGTGKTFSIEHVYVRLVLEKEPMEVEQILAVTFTRAATRELRQRIRTNLEKALEQLQSNEISWDYLEPLRGSKEALRALRDAISGFDQCQIFTIHGFCYRMLREFAFEAKMGLSIPNPDEKTEFPEALRQGVRDFLAWGLSSEIVCPEQVALLFRAHSSIDEIGEQLLKEGGGFKGKTFQQMFDECKAALHDHTPVDEALLLADFRSLEKDYKVQVKGDFEKQVVALSRWTSDLDNPIHFRTLLREEGSLFAFLDPSNRKVKAQGAQHLHFPGFFDWAKARLNSYLKPKAKEVLAILREAWKPLEEKIAAEHLDPDEILRQMQRALQEESFLKRIQSKYQAAIIDEFQDTDPMQWEIFRKISLTLRAFYLVGDPKQSIYRFRRADVYTYLAAKEFLGEANVYSLDTNFRSLPQLVDALNQLFQRNWLPLPKLGGTLPYSPVRAGVKEGFFEEDGKGALHFVKSEGEISLEKQLLPFAFKEIDRLPLPLDSFAVLVKDRYEAEKTVRFFQDRGIPAVARSHTPLGDTLAFQAVKELFSAMGNLKDESAARVVAAGPFGEVPLVDLRDVVLNQGLSACFRMLEGKGPLRSELMQVLGALFIWEKKEGFSFEGLESAFKQIATLDPEAEDHQEAVQVMTLHVSKGLEFDVVFAWGLTTKTPESGEEREEAEAEKLRQLYVAMTRAKKRLYAPLVVKPKEAKPGTHSPMELFSRYFSEAEIEKLPGEMLPDFLGAPFTTREFFQKNSAETFPLSPPHLPSSTLLSFTALAQEQFIELKPMEMSNTSFTMHTLPRGAETGVMIHGLFERIFSSTWPIWQDPIATRALVEKELFGSPLMPWQEAIQEMIQQVLDLKLEDVTLRQLQPKDIWVEVEFLFPAPPNWVKGFIDLVFCCRGRYSFIDWKTNWLGESSSDYTFEAMEQAMKAHDYSLQATLYKEALKRYLGNDSIGNAFYLFVRGNGVYEPIRKI